MIQSLLWTDTGENQRGVLEYPHHETQPLCTTSTTAHPEKPIGVKQNMAILEHLRSSRSITALEALNLYGVFRLASRIHDLRKCGITIETRPKTTPSGKKIAEYYLP